jgi:hypothetical protein
MSIKKTVLDKNKLDKIVSEARRDQAEREQSYRGQALKMYPWVCGRCTREFSHKNLAELTVHHRNHNHDDNPADGSNWELLCLYCHDNEHARYEEMRFGSSQLTAKPATSGATHNPFADLKSLLNNKK